MPNLSKLLFPNKRTGDKLTAAEVNEIKTKFNLLIDFINGSITMPDVPTVYTTTPQTYQTTPADFEAKCGIGTTGASVTRTNTTATGSTQDLANAAGLTAATQAAKDAIVCPVGAVVYQNNLAPGESASGVTYNGLPGTILRFNNFTLGDPLPGASIGFFVGGTPVGGADLGTTAALGIPCALSYNDATYTTGNGTALTLQNTEIVNLS